MGFWFNGMDNIGELDSILDEEYGYVIPDKTPIALRYASNM